MPNLNGGHLFIRCLKQEGVKKVFTIVGDTVLPLVDAAADEGIEFIDTRHEGAALHMADGYARITGEPAVATNSGIRFLSWISQEPLVTGAVMPIWSISWKVLIPFSGSSAQPATKITGLSEV